MVFMSGLVPALVIGVLADEVGSLSFSGQTVSIGINVYVLAILLIIKLLWGLFSGGRSRGGRY